MADLLLELRCEELPPRDLAEAAKSLLSGASAAFAETGLEPRGGHVAFTPRRIAVWLEGLPDRTPDREERVNGPKLRAAFDASGGPTKAAEGFARKVGVGVESLSRDAECVFAIVRTEGRAAIDIASQVLPRLPALVKWRKTMTWGPGLAFARPIRGVVALLGGDVVPCTVAGHAAGRRTRGHPFLAPQEFAVETASREEYAARMRSAFVLADSAERRDAVLSAARKVVPGLEIREALLDEVTNLVEWPTALLGRFDPRFLELPARLLVTVMEHHQRFFPVRSAQGGLLPQFVAVLDRDADSVETARRGFERVLVPRLHDAAFFFGEDRKSGLSERLAKLSDVTYHRKLGSVADKAMRLQKLAGDVAARLGLDTERVAWAREAGVLAKCDLATLLVGEFPELQGHVGSEYARNDGAPAEVCEAIALQYAHDFHAASRPSGTALALLLAENLDVLCQFGTKVGLPSGNADPFGVRRSALTLLEACDRFAPQFDVVDAIDAAGGDASIVEFVDTRLRHRLRDEGVRPDHLDAVASWRAVGEVRERIADLEALRAAPRFDRLLEVAERCRNITKKAAPADSSAPTPVRADLLSEPAERALFDAWKDLAKSLPPAPARLSRDDVARIAAALADRLHRFFADVFVNVDDAAVRTNRLALLREIDATLLRFADLCRIQRA